MLKEETLELSCLAWFEQTGWNIAHGPDISPDGSAPERSDYRDVILSGRLLASLQKLNPQIPLSALEEAVQVVLKQDHPVLEQRNREFHRLMLSGVPVSFRKGDEAFHDTVQLIDFQCLEK